MPWDIQRVYTLPTPSVIDHLKSIPLVENIYHVNDLEGIDGGLLAASPDVESGFYAKRRGEREPITNDYGGVNEFPEKLRLNTSHFNLFYLLKQVNEKNKVPVMYYQCATWGGPPDNEVCVVFDGDMFVYWFDVETGKHAQVINNQHIEIEPTVLQKGLQHLGLLLPTNYFVLHTRTFDLERYSII